MVRGIMSNWAALVITGMMSIVLTPILIHGLGHFYYGLWILVGSLVDYYGLFDAGLRVTLQRFVARLRAAGDHEAVSEACATGLALSGALACVIFGLTTIVAFIPSPLGLDLHSDPKHFFQVLLLCLGISVGITLPARLLGAVLCGLQRFDLYNLASVVTALLRGVVIIVGVKIFSMGVIGVALATLGAAVLLLVLNFSLVRVADRELRLDLRRVRLARTRELLGFSVYVFLNTAGDFLRSYTDALVIARVLNIALITPFSVAVRMMDYVKMIVFGAVAPFMPAMAALDAQGRDTDLARVFLRATRISALLVSWVAWLIVLNGDELYTLWLGPGFGETFVITLVLLGGFVLTLAQAPSPVMLTAKGRHRALALWTLGEGVANVILSVILAQRYGLIGVAVGTLIPMATVKLFIQPWYVTRVLDIPMGRYLKEAIVPALRVDLAFLVVAFLAGTLRGTTEVLHVAGAMAWQTCAFFLITWLLGLSADMRAFVRYRIRTLTRRSGRHDARASETSSRATSATFLRGAVPVMRVRDIGVESHVGRVALGAKVTSEVDDTAFHLEYLFDGLPAASISTRGDAFVPALLLPAMVHGEDLYIDGHVSPRLQVGARHAMDILHAWRRSFSIPSELRRISIKAPLSPSSDHGEGAGLFFSCGVDSFYSLIKSQDARDAQHRVSHLVLVHGFDVKLANTPLFEQMRRVATLAARHTGTELIVVRNNIREFSNRIISWDIYHGGALGSLGLAMSPVLQRCVIASTHAYGELVPWGSHPLLDVQWCTEGVKFVHDGCEALRTEKIRYLAESQLALQGLRVCWDNNNTAYNCGECEKCLRTMIGLEAVGALERCTTFDRPLEVQAIRRMKLDPSESSLRFIEDVVMVLGDSARDEEIRSALKYAMRKAKWRGRAGVFARQIFGQGATLERIGGATFSDRGAARARATVVENAGEAAIR